MRRALLTSEFVQHEAIHHGQRSTYASLAGFGTPLARLLGRVKRPNPTATSHALVIDVDAP